MAHFAVTAVGADRPGIVAAVTGAFAAHGCNLEDSSMTILRGQFAMMLVVDAPAGVGAGELQDALAGPAAELDLFVTVRPAAEPAPAPGPERPPEREAGPERPPEREAGPERPPEREAGPERPPEREAGPERPPEREAGPERPPEREAGPERPPEREAESESVSWTVSVYGADHPGIVHGIASLLADRQVNIVDLSTRVIGTPDAPVYTMFLDVTMPPAGDPRQLEADLAAKAGELGVTCRLHPSEADIL